MRVIFGLTVIGGAGLLGLAVWPGLLEILVLSFQFFCVSVPLLGLWFLLVVGLALRDHAAPPDLPGIRRRWGLRSAAVMFGTIGLLWFHVPQRIALASCYSGFRELRESAPAEFGGEELGRRVGPYRVDRYGADERGGVFFRTATGPDGIVGPDQMSYGFAFRPNGKGSPFGNARYRQRHLFGDWYAFAVSNDS